MDRFVINKNTIDGSKFEPRKPLNLIGAWEEIGNANSDSRCTIPLPFPICKGDTISITYGDLEGETASEGMEMSLVGAGLDGVDFYARFDISKYQKSDTKTITESIDHTKGGVYLYVNTFSFPGSIKRVVISKGSTPIYWEEIYGGDTELSTLKNIDMSKNDVIGHTGGV